MASTAPAQKEDRIVFSNGTRTYSVREVIDAAHFRGEIAAHWADLLARVAAARTADESNAEIDDAAVDAAAVAFRYQYDLITAEETERWLELHGLTLEEFSDYFARAEWAKTFRPKNTETVPPLHKAAAESRELLAIELTLNGALEIMANQLSWRVAAANSEEIAEPASEALEAEREAFRKRHGLELTDIHGWLEAFGRDEPWLEEQMRFEICFRREREKILTPAAAERELSSLRLPLTRFDVETIEFESRDAASEAILCVRDDGMTMEEVAGEGHYPYRRAEIVLEEIPDELQQKFLSVTPGTLLEPIAYGDEYQLSRIIGKTEPRADDPRVRARIEERILERHFAELTSKHIRWEIVPRSTE